MTGFDLGRFGWASISLEAAVHLGDGGEKAEDVHGYEDARDGVGLLVRAAGLRP